MKTDIYLDTSSEVKNSNFNAKYEKYKSNRFKLKRTKNSGLRRFLRIFKKEKYKIIILFIILIFILLILIFSIISQFYI